MVKPGMFVARTFILLVLLCPPLSLQADALFMELDKRESQIGHALNASLFLRSESYKLSEVDLTPLDRDFGVVIVDSYDGAEHGNWPGESLARLRLRLYPRRTGELRIPALYLDTIQSAKLGVRVLPGEAGGRAIEYRTHVSSNKVWQREQIVYRVEIISTDRFASLESDATRLKDFEVIALPPERRPLDDGRVRLSIGWALFPLASGAHKVTPPEVRYRLSGVTQRVYFPPSLEIAVRALPPYIPPTMPVGRIVPRGVDADGGLSRPGYLDYRRVQLVSESVPPYWMPPVLRQLKSSDEIRVLDAESRREISVNDAGPRYTSTHVIPFKPLGNGITRLPQLRVQYFDSASGRLRIQRYTPPPVYALNLFWRIVIIVPLALLLLYLARGFTRFLISRRRRRVAFKQALFALQQARGATELRAALRRTGAAMGWQDNLSLSAWSENWKKYYQHGGQLDGLMQTLSAASYGRRPTDGIGQLGSEFAKLIRGGRRKRARRLMLPWLNGGASLKQQAG